MPTISPAVTDAFAMFGAVDAAELRITGVFHPHVGHWVSLDHPQVLTVAAVETWAQIETASLMIGFGAVNILFPIADLTTN